MQPQDERPRSLPESYYRILIEGAIQGILVHRELQPLFVNPAFVEMFGYAHADEILQLETIEPLIAPTSQEQVQHAVASETPHVDRLSRYVLRHVLPNESTRWFDVTTKRIEWEDGPAIYMTLIDITSHREMEAEHQRVETYLRQSQRLNVLSTLTRSLAHDFNNLLGVLLVNLEVGLLDLPDAFRQQPQFQAALAAGYRAKELVQRLFTMDRQGEETRRPMNLAALIEEVCALIQPTLPETMVLNQVLDPQARGVVGNAAQLHQVLMNLCNNAVQAMEGREGILEIRLDAVIHDGYTQSDLAGLRAGRYARLQVRDNGPGLSPLALERLFEPFFTTKQDQGGAGLGLAIVHNIITAHQGAIIVSNNPTQGATFTLYLPQSTPDSD